MSADEKLQVLILNVLRVLEGLNYQLKALKAILEARKAPTT